MLINVPGIQAFKLPADPNLQLIQPKQHTFEIGKILSAVVVGTIGQNKLALNINNTRVNVQTSHHFMPGEELKVKVEKQNEQTVLKIQTHQLSKNVLTQALRQVLPKQAPATSVLNVAASLTQAQTSTSPNALSSLPVPVKEQLKSIHTNLTTLNQLTQSQGLKSAINNSGIFLESKLIAFDKNSAESATQSPPVTLGNDFKKQLLSFLKTINSQLETASKAPGESGLKTNASPKDAHVLTASLTTEPTGLVLPPKHIKPIDLSAQLQRAANLLRNANASMKPSLQTTLPAKSAEPLIEPNTKNQTNAASAPLKTQTYAASLGLTKQPSFMKHTSLPMPGGLPQPIKNDTTLPMEPHSPKHMLETLKDGVTNALSRIQANQLSTLMKDPFQLPTFLLDIPVNVEENQTEIIPFLLKQEDTNKDDEHHTKKHWSIMLALDMENLGPLQVKVSLNDDKINVNIWSEDPETKTLFEQKDDALKSALISEALSVGQVAYHQGLKDNEIDTSTINLLDLKV